MIDKWFLHCSGHFFQQFSIHGICFGSLEDCHYENQYVMNKDCALASILAYNFIGMHAIGQYNFIKFRGSIEPYVMLQLLPLRARRCYHPKNEP